MLSTGEKSQKIDDLRAEAQGGRTGDYTKKLIWGQPGLCSLFWLGLELGL